MNRKIITASVSLALMALAHTVPAAAAGAPDFTGVYGSIAPTQVPNPFLNGNSANVNVQSRDNTLHSFESDAAIIERGHGPRPLYRPEYWAKVRDADLHGNSLDSAFNCRPLGVPRMGPPQKIVQTSNELVFLYAGGNTFRTIAVDGRPENEFLLAEQNWMGYSRGKWEGATLVIETSGFTDNTWLGWPGWIHSADMRVIERMWWQDGKLMWQPTVYDEALLLEPFEMKAVAMTPSANPKAEILPDLPCEDRDLEVFERLNPKLRG